MSNEIRKGLNNVKETWEANEKARNEESTNSNESEQVPAASELDRVVREEAADYDNTSNEDRLQGGDRASVNDDDQQNV
jgi:hypothetical protein